MSVCDEYIISVKTVTTIFLNLYQSSKNILLLSIIKLSIFLIALLQKSKIYFILTRSFNTFVPTESVCDEYIFDTETIKIIFLNLYQSSKNLLLI